MREVGALIVMLPPALLAPNRREIFGLFRPAPNWKYSMPGTLLGSYLALIFWIAGMKYSMAGPAAILNQTSSIYVLIFASIFLKEPFTTRKVVASVLAIAGIVMVTLA
jgi:drug/metabolite transporter (DMT)-like permease